MTHHAAFRPSSHLNALIGLALVAVAPAAARGSAIEPTDPVWSLMAGLARAAWDGPADDIEALGLVADDPDDAGLRRMLEDGIALAQQTIRYPATQPVYRVQPSYVVPSGGYPMVQSPVNAAVQYWTGTPTYNYAQPAAQPAGYGDPYGFTSWLNGVRAQRGLGPVSYDPSLSAWANANNSQQNALGLGHHVMGPARRQNSAMGSFGSIGSQWLASPAHAAALLDPSIRVIGIAGMGAYWTFNAY